MRHLLIRCMFLFAAMAFCVGVTAQNKTWREMHKVESKETLFGISKKYGITVEELVKANPDMSVPGYTLKKGDYIFIPYSSTAAPGKTPSTAPAATAAGKAVAPAGALRVGVVLPLHNVDGDGRRMLEYYRGLLMACEDLKKEGMSIAVSAWNVPIDADIYQTLVKDGIDKCDVIFGPLYSKQVKPLSFFVKDHDIKLVIPFSITGDDVDRNPNIFQVYQSPEDFYGRAADHFVYRFKDYNIVVVDCNDKTSDKGVFTFGLRKKLAANKIPCNVTNLNSSDEMFFKAFSAVKPNMVVLNTGRSPELNQVLERLDMLTGQHPSLKVSLFGYTEWLMYVKYNLDRFCKYDTYIPSTFYYNTYSSKVRKFEDRYLGDFKSGMMDYLPRFAITGYDHGMFFLRGLHKYGKGFTGAEEDKNALQAWMHFAKAKSGGGYRNTSLLFIHYNRDKSISIINF